MLVLNISDLEEDRLWEILQTVFCVEDSLPLPHENLKDLPLLFGPEHSSCSQ